MSSTPTPPAPPSPDTPDERAPASDDAPLVSRPLTPLVPREDETPTLLAAVLTGDLPAPLEPTGDLLSPPDPDDLPLTMAEAPPAGDEGADAPPVSGPVPALPMSLDVPELPRDVPSGPSIDGAAQRWADDAIETILEADDIDVAMEPGPLEAALDRLARETYTDRVALYEAELAEEPDKARAALLEHEIGDQIERIGGDEGLAVKAYARSLASDPMLRPNLWAVRRIFYRRRLWPSLVKLLDAETRYASSDIERAELWTERGHVQEDCLSDPNEAERCYESAHRLDPSALAPLSALEKRYAARGDQQGLLTVARAMAAATTEPGRRAALLIDLCHAELDVAPGKADERAEGEETSPLDRALSYLHAAYEAGVDQLRVVDEIIRLTQQHGRLPDCLAALDVKAEILQIQAESAPPQRHQLLLEQEVEIRRVQARLAREGQGDLPLSWQYLQAANDRSPGDPLILADLIETAETLGRWGDLEALLGVLGERRRLGRPDALPSPGLLLQRAAALRLAGREQEADALEADVQALFPGHIPLLLLHERRALRRQELAALAALYQQEAEIALVGLPIGRRGDLHPDLGEAPRTADPLWAAGALLRAGSCLLRAGEYPQAAAVLEQGLGLLPPGVHPAQPRTPDEAATRRLLLDALEAAYERAERWDDLCTLYERELGGVAELDPLRAARLCEALIETADGRLGQPGRALRASATLCRLHPDDLRLHLRAAALARRADDARAEADALAELARLEARLPFSVRGLQGLLRRAELLGGPLQDLSGAIALYEEALRLRPGEPQALLPLEDLLRRASRHADLYRLLRRQVDACAEGPDPERLLALQVRLAEICENELAQPAEAAAVYRDILIRRPGYLPALRALVRLYRRTGDHARLAGVLELLAEAVPQGETRADVLLRLAEVYEGDLDRPAEAEDAYLRATEEIGRIIQGQGGLGEQGAAATGVEAEAEILQAHAALGRLRTLARRREYGRMASVLERCAEGLPPWAQAHLAEERAALPGRRELNLLRLAQAAWERPRQPISQDGQVDQDGQDGADGGADRLPLPALGLWRHGATSGDARLVGEALAALAAAGRDPAAEDGEAVDPVGAALFLRAGVLSSLASLASLAAEGEAAPEDRAAAEETSWRRLLQSARLAPEPDAGPVLQILSDAIERAPAAHPLPEAAALLHARAELCPQEEGGDRLRLHLAEGEVLLASAAAAPDDAEAAGLRQRAAEAAATALAHAPDDLPALLLLRRALQPDPAAADPAEAHTYALLTLRLSESIRDPGRKADLCGEAAALLLSIGDHEGAAAALRALLDHRPDDALAFGQLYELLMVRAAPPPAGPGDAGPLLELLNHRLAWEPAEEAARAAERPLRVALLLQRAALRQAAEREPLAIADLRALLSLDPGHLMARRRLADLLLAEGHPEEALLHYERALTLEEDETERRAVHIQAARILSDTDAARASDHLRQAIAIGRKRWQGSSLSPASTGSHRITATPESVGVEGALYRWQVRLLLSQGHYGEAVEVLGQLAALVPPGPDHGIEQARVELEIADVLLYQARDPRGALRALERAIQADPLSLEALDRLVTLCAELNEPALPQRHLLAALSAARSQAAAQRPEELSGEPYHALGQIFQWLAWPDAHRLALQAEAVLAGVQPGLAGRPPPLVAPKRAINALVGVLGSKAFPSEARGLMLEVWREIAETANALLAPEIQALSANPRERLNAKGAPTVWADVDRLAQALGLGQGPGLVPYGLFLSRDREMCQITGANLICGTAYAAPLAELPPALSFRLLQRMALLPERMGPVLSAGSEDLILFVAACCRLIEARGPELLPVHASQLEERTRVLGRIISRKEKKGLLAMAPRLAPLGGERGRELIAGWQQAVTLGAARMALTLSGDMQATLAGVGLANRETDARRARLLQSLLLYAVSADIHELRRELGLDGSRAAQRS